MDDMRERIDPQLVENYKTKGKINYGINRYAESFLKMLGKLKEKNDDSKIPKNICVFKSFLDPQKNQIMPTGPAHSLSVHLQERDQKIGQERDQKIGILEFGGSGVKVTDTYRNGKKVDGTNVIQILDIKNTEKWGKYTGVNDYETLSDLTSQEIITELRNLREAQKVNGEDVTKYAIFVSGGHYTKFSDNDTANSAVRKLSELILDKLTDSPSLEIHEDESLYERLFAVDNMTKVTMLEPEKTKHLIVSSIGSTTCQTTLLEKKVPEGVFRKVEINGLKNPVEITMEDKQDYNPKTDELEALFNYKELTKDTTQIALMSTWGFIIRDGFNS